MGKEVIEYLGKEKPTLTRFLGLLGIIITLAFISPLVTDLVNEDIKEDIVIVETIERASTKNFLYKYVYTDKVVLTNWFDEFHFNKGKAYKVTYYNKTGIILNVESL